MFIKNDHKKYTITFKVALHNSIGLMDWFITTTQYTHYQPN